MMEKTTTRALLLRTLAELSEVRGQLEAINVQLQRQAQAGGVLQISTADTPTDEAVDDQAELADIASLPAEELPSFVTRQAQNDDGTPKLGPDGLPVLLRQNGKPLSVLELAIVQRQAKLRRQAGG